MTDWLTVHIGDNRVVLDTLPERSVHCVVTSPPYWGLRDYGTATWEGGSADCDHLAGPLASPKSTLQGYTGPDVKLAVGGMPYRDVCRKCGARRIDSQLGLEATPEEYVAAMVDVFRKIWRVLRDDGTLWLNLGDSYAGGGPMGTSGGHGPNAGVYRAKPNAKDGQHRIGGVDGLAQKQLVGIPWRVAFALQADGWYLRSDIIWAKPNPMPESVTDRPTKSHEYVFLLAKSPRYFFDQDAVREPHTESTLTRIEYGLNHRHPDGIGIGIPPVDTDRMGERFAHPAGRNIRTVWTVNTKPYPGAHFAVFPEALVEPCIKAGCPEGGVVLDPFAGSGTVGVVANKLSRRAVLIDLNPEYLSQIDVRNQQSVLGLVG